MKTFSFSIVAFSMIFVCFFAPLTIAEPPVEKLETRAAENWQLRKEQKWDEVYDYYTNAYREEVTRVDFIKRANVNIKAFRIGEIEFSEDKSTGYVTVYYDALMQSYVFKDMKTKEEWIYEDGTWRISPKTKKFIDLFKNE